MNQRDNKFTSAKEPFIILQSCDFTRLPRVPGLFLSEEVYFESLQQVFPLRTLHIYGARLSTVIQFFIHDYTRIRPGRFASLLFIYSFSRCFFFFTIFR